MRVFPDVREGFRDDVVRRHLDCLGEASADSDRESDRNRGVRRELLERHCKAVARDDRRVNAACDLAQLFERSGDLLSRSVDPFRCVSVTVEPLLEPAQVEGEGHESLLSPVVKVPLQTLAFALGGLEDPRARSAELLEPRSKLDVELGVLQREAERGGDGVQELGLLLERRIVKKRGNSLAVALDVRGGPGLTRLGQGDCLAVGIRVGPELRQPVDKGDGRVAQSAGEGLLQLRRVWVAAKLDEEISDRGTRKPGSKMSGEEQHGRDAHQGEGDPPGLVPSRRADHHHHDRRDQRHQRKAETGDEELE